MYVSLSFSYTLYSITFTNCTGCVRELNSKALVQGTGHTDKIATHVRYMHCAGKEDGSRGSWDCDISLADSGDFLAIADSYGRWYYVDILLKKIAACGKVP